MYDFNIITEEGIKESFSMDKNYNIYKWDWWGDDSHNYNLTNEEMELLNNVTIEEIKNFLLTSVYKSEKILPNGYKIINCTI